MIKKHSEILVIASLLIAVNLSLYGCGHEQENSLTNETEDASQIASETESELSFPLELNDGRLMVNSVFGSDIMNPDCNDEYGENIVSLEFVNNSDNDLVHVTFDISLSDGSKVTITAEDIPAHATAWAFAQDNAMAEEILCEALDATAEFADGVLIDKSKYEIAVSDTVISIKNLTTEDMHNLTLHCHCDMGDVLFGGTVYSYSIAEIAQGDSVTIDAIDCYMGTARVVYIE